MLRTFHIISAISLILLASGIARTQLGLPASWLVISGLIVVTLNGVWLAAACRIRRRAAGRGGE